LLTELLPLDEELNAVTIRSSVESGRAEEEELGPEQVSFIEGCPAASGLGAIGADRHKPPDKK
jgi:hypothetical protein